MKAEPSEKTGPIRVGQTDGREIKSFNYRAPQTGLDDLKRRLAQTRWPERETASDWSQGVPLEEMRALVDYWRSDYEERA